jgi:Ca2+-binding RTX toxin-like protein
MYTKTLVLHAGKRALATGALAGAFLAALLIFAAHPAHAAVTARVQAGTLKIVGDDAGDKLLLALASPTTLAVDVGEDGTLDFSFDRSTFTTINVQMGGGDDEVRVLNGLTEPVTINGGLGNDTLLGGSEADLLLGGAGNDFVDGNIGSDTAQLGGGNDVFQWDPGDGSDVVDGQGGDDRLAFNGSNAGEKMDVSANGPRVRFTRDIAAIVMDLGGIEHIGIRTLGSADTVTVNNLAGTDAKTVDVDLSGFDGNGDAAADTVVVNGTDAADQFKLSNSDGALVVGGLAAQTRATGGEVAMDTVDVAGLGGDDTLNATAGVTGSAQVTFDGGEGNDTTRFNGTAGDDQIGIAANTGPSAATFATGGVIVNTIATTESLVVSGLDGNDTILGQNGIANITALTIDGGNGNDTLGGGDGADLLLGGPGNDHVDGNRGEDRALLDGGDDTFQWDPGDGSDVVEGQSGDDRLAFNGSNAGEKIDVSANGPRVRLTRDIAAIVMDMDGIEHVGIRTLGSVDTVTVNDLAGTAAKTVDVDLSGFDGSGDGAADQINVMGTANADKVKLSNADGALVVGGLAVPTRVTGGEPATDVVTVMGLAGDDTLTATVGVTGSAQVTFDGGEGVDATQFNGTAGDDQIGIAANAGPSAATFAPGGVVVNTIATTESLIVSGLDGNDTILGQNGIATITALTIDGGNGNDTLGGGDGADLLLGGPGNDHVDGNRGEDRALLDGGDDVFQWDPGDGSDVVEGQAGDDRLAFNGSNAGERVAVFANGDRILFTRDIAAISMDVNGVEHVSFRALGSSDTITVGDLSGTGVKSVDLDLSGFDGNVDGAADAIFVDGTARRDVVQVTRSGSQVSIAGLPAQITIVGSEPTDALEIETLGGNDDVTVAPDVADLINTVVDLGADE